jgi:hypothetical protein
MVRKDDNDGAVLLQDIGNGFAADGDLDWGTLFGFTCLRRKGEFVSANEHLTGSLVVKLPKMRVLELIEAGTGEEFRPNGRVFREWVAVAEHEEGLWRDLITESIAFADTNAAKKAAKSAKKRA